LEGRVEDRKKNELGGGKRYGGGHVTDFVVVFAFDRLGFQLALEAYFQVSNIAIKEHPMPTKLGPRKRNFDVLFRGVCLVEVKFKTEKHLKIHMGQSLAYVHMSQRRE